MQDYSNFSPENFNNELTQINWDIITLDTHQDIDQMSSTFYNKFNGQVNKHEPLKTLSGPRQNDFQNHGSQEASDDQLKTKDKLFLSGDTQKYKLYRIII